MHRTLRGSPLVDQRLRARDVGRVGQERIQNFVHPAAHLVSMLRVLLLQLTEDPHDLSNLLVAEAQLLFGMLEVANDLGAVGAGAVSVRLPPSASARVRGERCCGQGCDREDGCDEGDSFLHLRFSFVCLFQPAVGGCRVEQPAFSPAKLPIANYQLKLPLRMHYEGVTETLNQAFTYNPSCPMQFTRLSILLAALPVFAQQAPLSCPPPPAGRSCEAFHYHVQMYRPDTKAYAEIFAGAPFATQAACERVREQQVAANMRIVEYFRTVREQQQYPPDRFGSCHCDMTGERSSATYLGEPQRVAQLRNAEEIRLRVRERLLDARVPAGADIIRSLYSSPLPSTALSMPKMAPLPPPAPVAVAASADDLQATRTIDTTKPAAVALDLPLSEIGGAASAPVVAGGTTSSPALVARPPAVISTTPPVVTPEVVIVEPETRVDAPQDPLVSATEPTPATEEETPQSAQETAERFISYENQRIQNVLRASSSIDDEDVKTRVFEAAMERIQLLSNLRQLIEGSGVRSRLTTAAADVMSEADRLDLVQRLFGSTIKRHWAPRDAADVVVELDSSITNAPERVLRDSSGAFSADQKKSALYLVLARTQPTEDQRLWLSTVVEGFLR